MVNGQNYIMFHTLESQTKEILRIALILNTQMSVSAFATVYAIVLELAGDISSVIVTILGVHTEARTILLVPYRIK